MSTERSTQGAFFLLLSMDVKFANTSPEKTPNILNQLKDLAVFYNRFKIDYRYIISACFNVDNPL